jgi:hypothetical protein
MQDNILGFTHDLRGNRTSRPCDRVPFLISFGVHGLKPKAWCSITTGRLVKISESDSAAIAISFLR